MKSCPKCNKQPNMVTMQVVNGHFWKHFAPSFERQKNVLGKRLRRRVSLSFWLTPNSLKLSRRRQSKHNTTKMSTLNGRQTLTPAKLFRLSQRTLTVGSGKYHSTLGWSPVKLVWIRWPYYFTNNNIFFAWSNPFLWNWWLDLQWSFPLHWVFSGSAYALLGLWIAEQAKTHIQVTVKQVKQTNMPEHVLN